jgi:hypothetical protein
VNLGRDHGVGPRRSGPTLAGQATPLMAGILLLVAIAVAARAGGDGRDRGSPALPPPSAGGRSPSELPNQMAPEPAVGLRPLAWTRTEPVGRGRRLRVYATLGGGPPCTVLGRVDAEETAAAVTITLWTGRRPGARCDGPRAAVALPIVVTVDLREPLGRRAVRDGATRRP